VEEKKISHLKRELKLKEFQFNSIYEFSEAIYSSFHVESIIRIYFSTLMGQLGVSRVFFYDSEHHLLHRRGFKFNEGEEESFLREIKKLGNQWFSLKVDELTPVMSSLKDLLLEKRIRYLVNISESEHRTLVLGLSEKANNKEFTSENIEYAYFVSKFAASAIENALLVDRLIETKRMEHEFKIARDIQLSLLPQSLPELDSFEISVIYEPINEVGGDYYDILKRRNGEIPILIADVEGKGLSAALLAASSQAVFRSLSDLYFFEASKFVSKANELIYDFTRGNRFITLFWMLLNNKKKTITYVNAGHVEPFLISGDTVRRLDKGGILTGFVPTAPYEMETVELKPGDIIAAFTDGVSDVENKDGEEFGVDAIAKCLQNNRHLSAPELNSLLFKTVDDFSQKKKFKDDFTSIILKVKP
jgi:phosphoserine phosphatase RsbU/P